MVLKYCNYIHLMMVYNLIFIIDLSYIQIIKRFIDIPLSIGCMICLYDKFETLRDGTRL